MSDDKQAVETISGSKLDISLARYLWDVSPLSGNKRNSIPLFLKNSRLFKGLSDYELKKVMQYIHTRSFDSKEMIFDQGDPGVGFYLIFKGHVEIIAKDHYEDLGPMELNDTDSVSGNERHVTLLEKGDYFGELAIIQNEGLRTAAARARDNVTVLCLFKPDIDMMIEKHPSIASKLLLSISRIIAGRFSIVTDEIRILKYKLNKLENSLDS